MIELPAFNKLRKFVPRLWFNKDGVVTVELKCAMVEETQASAIEQAGMTPEKVHKMSNEFLAKHVGKIEGLKVGGVKVESFEDVLKHGPPELYSWIATCINSAETLSREQEKN